MPTLVASAQAPTARRCGWLIVFAALAWAGGAAGQSDEDSRAGIGIEVTAGFAGKVAPGWAMPLHIQVTRAELASGAGGPGPETIRGTLEIRTYRAAQVRWECHIEELELAPGARLEFDQVGPDGDEVEVAFTSEHRRLAAGGWTPAWPEPDAGKFVVVVGGPAGWLSFADRFGLPDGESAYGPSRSLRMVGAESRTLPAHPAGWDGVDLVVLGDLSGVSVAPARVAALLDWIRAGGRALVCGGRLRHARDGQAWQGLFRGEPGAAVERPLGAAAAGAWRVADLADTRVHAETWRGAAGRDPFPGGAAPLVIDQSLGWGTVTWLNFDPTAAPLRGHARESEFWTGLLTWQLGRGTPAQVFTKMKEATPDELTPELPRPGVVLLTAFVYAVLAGPINFLVLRRCRREAWLWLSTPGLAVIGFVVVLWLGLDRAASAPLARAHTVWLTSSGPDPGATLTVWSILTPRTMTLGWDLPAGDRETVFLPFSTPQQPGLKPPPILRRETGAEIRYELPLGDWDSQEIVCWSRGQAAVGATSSVSENQRLSLRLTAPAPCQQVCVLHQGALYATPTLAPETPWEPQGAPFQGGESGWDAVGRADATYGMPALASAARPLLRQFPRTEDGPDAHFLASDRNGGAAFFFFSPHPLLSKTTPVLSTECWHLALWRFPDPVLE